MMIGQIVPLAEVDRAGFLRFTQAGRRCVVAETWGMYYGLIAQDDGFARVVSEGWSREWVASATAEQAGPAVDLDLLPTGARPTASARRPVPPPLDPDWDDLAIDEEADYEAIAVAEDEHDSIRTFAA